MRGKNPKFEYRNPKQIANSKFKMRFLGEIGILNMDACLGFGVWNLGFLPSKPI
jgi:hypothetical protein